jgi:hypothetical protein
MGILHIQEYVDVGVGGDGKATQAAREPALTNQAITTSGAAALSAAFGSQTRLVRLAATGVVAVLFGKAPVAVVTDMRLSAGAAEYFIVLPGDKISVIDAT